MVYGQMNFFIYGNINKEKGSIYEQGNIPYFNIDPNNITIFIIV